MMKHAYVACAILFATGLASAGLRAETAVVSDNPAPASETIVVAASQQGFDRWRNGFRGRAIARGIRPAVFDAAFRGLKLRPRVLELDGKQPEFTRTIWDYVNRTVSDKRVNEGRLHARNLRNLLGSIERTYGVDARVVMAIWGIETNFGGFMGGSNVIESLATLAYDGRRRDWAERELVAALQILQNGDTRPENMEGSWAGAMGHTQFMPTSYQAYAVDFTGDGRRDLWADDPSDALASAANYLRVHGWTKGQPWGMEVTLPKGFNYAETDMTPSRPVSYWNNKGVRLVGGGAVPNYGKSGLWTPAGAGGPAFVVFSNFFVIKRYNRADSYALSVGHLGDRIFGDGKFVQSWPKDVRALSRTERREMQSLLTRRGFDTKGVDGLIGRNTIQAIRAFQRSVGLVPDGHASLALLQRLR